MNLPVDQQIDDLHRETERVEAEARQIEARILKAGGIPPRRQYGKPVSGADVARNLTLRSQLQLRDPALAAFLGCGSDLHIRQAEERAAAAMRADALRMRTDRLRQQNAAERQQREQRLRAGLHPGSGKRMI